MNQKAEQVVCQAETLLAERRLVEALERFSEAERWGAEADRCAGGRWLAHMLYGHFEDAWRESDAIRGRGGDDPHRFWQGEAVMGKRVMLRCLHGLGDAVQFLRYMPQLQALAASVVLQVNPRLVELAPRFAGVTEVITWGEDAPEEEPEWDVQIEVMELPYLFRTQMRDLPIAERYLRGPAEEIKPRTTCMRVGVVWSAGEWNTMRSVPVRLLEPLLATSGCEFWCLESRVSAEDCDFVAATMRQDAGASHNILRLAELIAGMDLVVTVDTLAAHLAGAMGVPCWVMLGHAADWRWMDAREDSPWYPSLRLYRQESEGAWQGVIERMRQALQERVADHRRRETED